MVQDFAYVQNQAPAVEMTNVNGRGSSVKLMIFPPRRINDEVIRPYIYKFSEQLISDIVSGNGIMETLGNGIGSSVAMNNCVLPVGNGGIKIHSSQISVCWTFILIVDQHVARGYDRHILCGYFEGEPINPTTGTPNPDSVLRFTGNQVQFSEDAVGMLGPQASVNIMHDRDVIPSNICGLANSTDLFRIDPAALAAATTHIDKGEAIVGFGDSSLSAIGYGINMPTRLGSPKHHMREIGSAIQSASAADEAINSGIISDIAKQQQVQRAGQDLSNMFSTMMAMELGGSYQVLAEIGNIDPGYPISLSALCEKFNNDVDIIPVGIQDDLINSERDHAKLSPQNTMSYMIAQTVKTIANCQCVSNLSFRYDSTNMNAMMPDNGAFEIFGAWGGSSFMTANMLQKAVTNVMFELEANLWPMVRLAAGEFSVWVYYDMSSDTVIQLQLHSYPDGNDGLYRTINQLGGLVSSSVGTDDHITHNLNELTSLTNSLQLTTNTPMEFNTVNVID